MQKKRNIRLMVLLVLLIASTAAVFLYSQSGGEAVIDKTIFKTDLSTVDRIVLMKEEKKIELKFDGARWMVNAHLADRRMVEVLFATLQQAEPKRPVAESIRDSISNYLNQQAVKVSLYAGGELQQEFLAGGNEAKTQAYFKKPNDSESFVMVIPGYRVYTAGIFELDENGWKDKYIFSFNWVNLSSLKVLFPDDPKRNFEVIKGRDYFEVKDVTLVDTTKLNDFLDAVSLLTVDGYADKMEVLTMARVPKPLVEILVTDVGGKTYSLKLNDLSDLPTVLADIQGTQYAFIDKRKIAPILKSRTWFSKK